MKCIKTTIEVPKNASLLIHYGGEAYCTNIKGWSGTPNVLLLMLRKVGGSKVY